MHSKLGTTQIFSKATNRHTVYWEEAPVESRGGFPNLASSAHCRRRGFRCALEEASSIPGLYSPMLPITPSPQPRQPKLFPDIGKCPLGAKLPLRTTTQKEVLRMYIRSKFNTDESHKVCNSRTEVTNHLVTVECCVYHGIAT